MKNPRRVGQDDDDWSMPYGDSIYTHAPDSTVGQTGTAQNISDKPNRRKPRRIGFRPPQVKK